MEDKFVSWVDNLTSIIIQMNRIITKLITEFEPNSVAELIEELDDLESRLRNLRNDIIRRAIE